MWGVRQFCSALIKFLLAYIHSSFPFSNQTLFSCCFQKRWFLDDFIFKGYLNYFFVVVSCCKFRILKRSNNLNLLGGRKHKIVTTLTQQIQKLQHYSKLIFTLKRVLQFYTLMHHKVVYDCHFLKLRWNFIYDEMSFISPEMVKNPTCKMFYIDSNLFLSWIASI